MRKLKLLIAACTLMMGAGQTWAQKDVTATYIPNAGFEDCTAYTADIVAADATDKNVDYTSNGWTASAGVAWSSAAVVAYGGTGQVNSVSAPSADNEGNSGNALGVSVGWGGVVTYKTANVTLPAGYYRLSVNAYNNLSGVNQFYSKLGFVTSGGTEYISNSHMFTYGKWSVDDVVFHLSEATEGYFQIGGGAVDGGSGSNAKVFFDNLTLTQYDAQVDYTSSVSTTEWSGANGSTSNNDISLKELYGNTTAGTKMYQTVTGLRNGYYKAVVYATSHNARGEGDPKATLDGTRDDLSYIFATSGDATKKTYFTASGVTPGWVSGDPIIVTVDNIEVANKQLTLGLGLEEGGITGWHTIQIKALYRIGDLDLSSFISAYESALAKAKTVAATTETISATVLAALNATINTYDADKVDKEDADDLEAATTALTEATNSANTSIASYALIATGTISTDNATGWASSTPKGTFALNTWSTAESVDQSEMVRNYIQVWDGSNALGEGKLYYTLTGLEPGEKIYVQALCRVFNSNEGSLEGASFFVNSDEVAIGGTICGGGYDTKAQYGTFQITGTVDSEGKLQFGISNSSTSELTWLCIKNVKIMTSADAITAKNAEWTALKEKANTLANTPNDNETATSALSTAITTQQANVDAATNAEAVISATAALKSAMTTFVNAATPTGDNQFDMTFVLTNPDLTGHATWAATAGWYTEQSGGNSQVMQNDGVKSSDDKSWFYEYWSEAAAANDKFTLYQKLNLAKGTYTIKCYAFAAQPTGGSVHGVYFYANETQGSCVTTANLTQQEISFVNSTEQEVKIGLKALSGNNDRWMGIGYVELYKVPAQTYAVSEDEAYDNTQSGAGTVTLTRTIKAGVNTLVLPFSMTQTEVETKFGTGSKVYVVKSYDAAAANISFDVKDGISANEPCLLKATEAGTSYTLDDRTIVAGTPTKAGTDVTMTGTYAASHTVPTGSYIVSGDKLYNVDSVVTLKGTRAYITVTDPTPARVLTMSFDGEATGIATIDGGELKVETGVVYDLSGRKVTAPAKGVYVINGKKIVK